MEHEVTGNWLEQVISEFAGLDREERLELLIDYARELPPLPPDRLGLSRDASCKINECQTPVYLDCSKAGNRLHFVADVPEKSPTVRGFVALLVNHLEGSEPQAAESLSPDLLQQLGLQEVLGMTRVRGFAGILKRIRRLALEDSSGSVGDSAEGPL